MLAVTRESIQRQLVELPAIIDLYAQGEPAFVPKALTWLNATEKAMSQLRQPEAALMATLRGRLLAAQDGLRDPEVGAGLTPRKALRATAAICLSRAESVLRERVNAIDAQLQPIRTQMAQLISVCSLMRPISLTPSDPREIWLRAVWNGLPINDAVRPMHAFLTTALGPTDRLYLLDELLVNMGAGEVSTGTDSPV